MVKGKAIQAPTLGADHTSMHPHDRQPPVSLEAMGGSPAMDSEASCFARMSCSSN